MLHFFGDTFSHFSASSELTSVKMSDAQKFTSLEDCLNKNVPTEELKEVKRILYGRSDE